MIIRKQGGERKVLNHACQFLCVYLSLFLNCWWVPNLVIFFCVKWLLIAYKRVSGGTQIHVLVFMSFQVSYVCIY